MGLLLFAITAAQAQKNGTVKGIVIDTLIKKPVASATITILKKSDSSLVSFTITDPDGRFDMTGIAKGSYQLLITHVNYHSTSRDFVLDDNKGYADIGTVIVNDKNIKLKEVVIAAQAPPITMIGDTVQYHAGSFKTPPNASVEKLLKKLPGIEVAKDGTITAHGKKVGRLLVDGREFFGNDPTIATKNLTADIVDKIQVYDTQSEKAALTGFDDGEGIKTINVKLKADKKKGLFGKLMASGGTADRYAAKGNANMFKGTQQMSVIAAANNLNDNVSGVPSGGGSNTYTASSGDAGSGIRETRAGGLNYNDIIGKRADFTSNYFFNQGNQRNGVTTQRQYLLPDSTYFYNQDRTGSNRSNTHKLNLGIDYIIDPFHSFKIRPSIGFTDGLTNSSSSYKQFGEDKRMSGEGENNTTGKSKMYDLGSEIAFRKKFHTNGRAFLFTLNSMFNKNENNDNMQASNRFYGMDGSQINTGNDLLQQQSTGYSNNFDNRASIVYTEPLFKQSLLEFNINNRTERRSSDLVTYDYNTANGKYDLLNNKQSSNFKNGSNILNSGIVFHSRSKKYAYSFGAGWQFTSLQGKIIAGTRDSIIGKTFRNILPSGRFQYNFTKSKSLTLLYSTATNLPLASQLQPVADLSSLPNIREGNPNLKQAYLHNLQLNYNAVNIFKGRSLFSGLMYSRTDHKISNTDSIVNGGARYSRPINLDDAVHRLSANIGASFPIRVIRSKMRFNMGTSYSTDREFLNNQENKTNTLSLSPTLNMDISISEKIDLALSGRINFNTVESSLQTGTDRKYTSQLYEAEFNWELPAGFYFSTEFNYNINTNPAMDKKVILPLWNAAISKQFLKGKRGELKLEVNDLLDRNISFNQANSPGFIESNRTLTLHRYGLLKFTYNLSRAI
jgi:hypothetical protein